MATRSGTVYNKALVFNQGKKLRFPIGIQPVKQKSADEKRTSRSFEKKFLESLQGLSSTLRDVHGNNVAMEANNEGEEEPVQNAANRFGRFRPPRAPRRFGLDDGLDPDPEVPAGPLRVDRNARPRRGINIVDPHEGGGRPLGADPRNAQANAGGLEPRGRANERHPLMNYGAIYERQYRIPIRRPAAEFQHPHAARGAPGNPNVRPAQINIIPDFEDDVVPGRPLPVRPKRKLKRGGDLEREDVRRRVFV